MDEKTKNQVLELIGKGVAVGVIFIMYSLLGDADKNTIQEVFGIREPEGEEVNDGNQLQE